MGKIPLPLSCLTILLSTNEKTIRHLANSENCYFLLPKRFPFDTAFDPALDTAVSCVEMPYSVPLLPLDTLPVSLKVAAPLVD